MTALLLQAVGLAVGVVCAFLIGWHVGGIAAGAALVFVGLAVEGH